MSVKNRSKKSKNKKSEGEAENKALRVKLRKLNAERALLQKQNVEIMSQLLFHDVFLSDDELADSLCSSQRSHSCSHRSKTSSCSSTNSSAISASSITNDESLTKSKMENVEKIECCLFCDKQFETESLLKDHVASHSAWVRTMFVNGTMQLLF